MTLPNQELVNYSMAPNNRGVGNNREGWHIRSNLIIGGGWNNREGRHFCQMNFIKGGTFADQINFHKVIKG